MASLFTEPFPAEGALRCLNEEREYLAVAAAAAAAAAAAVGLS